MLSQLNKCKGNLTLPSKITPIQLYQARQLLGLSQEEIAQSVGLSRQSYSKIEKGGDTLVSKYYDIISFFEKRGLQFLENGSVEKIV